jgi:two-component system, cell cycle sensor histidine kinase and response regulator CckA
VVDREGRVVRFNRECELRTGFRADEVIGRSAWETVAPPEEQVTTRPAFDLLCAGGSPTKFESHILTKDGKRRRIMWSNRGIAGPDGSVVYVVGTGIDVTEQRLLEEQFRQSQKMEAVGRLAGGVAHDFNNLLTAITGYGDLVLMRLNESDPIRPDVEEMKSAAHRAAALTRQLLAFSRKQTLAPTLLDLNAVVRKIHNLLKRLIGEDIQLTERPDPALGTVEADPGQIEQVIMNLAVNARDAMPTGGKLTLETANVDVDEAFAIQNPDLRAGRYVLLAVSDTGTGMSEEVRSHLFEPFFTTKEQGRGTGLGLATVFGIVKQSGGAIEVLSEVGRGTTFKVYLPRAGKTKPVEVAPAVKAPERGSETILLVEDDDIVRTLSHRILASTGYKVLEARNGGEALAICESYRDPIHALVTDVVMPVMSGKDLADRLVRLRPAIKVLFLSGYTSGALGDHGVLADGVAFLQKPFSPDALKRRVREVLDERAR